MRSRWAGVVLLLLSGCSGGTGEGGGPAVEVHGTVYRPAEGVLVNVYRPGDDLRGPPVTQLGPLDGRGSFSVGLPAGEYVFVARQRRTGESAGPVQEGDLKTDPVTVRVEPGQPLKLDLLAYVKEGNPKESFGAVNDWRTAVAGRVVDPEGKPLAGIRIHVYDHVQMSERPKFVSARTGPDGRYRVALPEGGTYYLCARDNYGGPPKVGDLYGRYDRGTVDPSAVVVGENEVADGVDITVHTVW